MCPYSHEGFKGEGEIMKFVEDNYDYLNEDATRVS